MSCSLSIFVGFSSDKSFNIFSDEGTSLSLAVRLVYFNGDYFQDLKVVEIVSQARFFRLLWSPSLLLKVCLFLPSLCKRQYTFLWNLVSLLHYHCDQQKVAVKVFCTETLLCGRFSFLNLSSCWSSYGCKCTSVTQQNMETCTLSS